MPRSARASLLPKANSNKVNSSGNRRGSLVVTGSAGYFRQKVEHEKEVAAKDSRLFSKRGNALFFIFIIIICLSPYTTYTYKFYLFFFNFPDNLKEGILSCSTPDAQNDNDGQIFQFDDDKLNYYG